MDRSLVCFAQEFRGTRVYIPHAMRDDHDIVEAIDLELADKFSRAKTPTTSPTPGSRAGSACPPHYNGILGQAPGAAGFTLGRFAQFGVSKKF